jgi:hypothetical protein
MVKPKFNKPLNKLFWIVFYLKLPEVFNCATLNGYFATSSSNRSTFCFDWYILFAIAFRPFGYNTLVLY